MIDKLRKDINYGLLALILILTWYNYFNLNLFSEDFLVISFQKDVSLSNIFSIFFSKNVDGVYWRPLTYLTYRIIELVSPDNIYLHRLTSFGIYSILTFILYDFLKKLSIEKDYAFLSTALFATLYHHDLQVAWIPARTDTLMTIFILLNTRFIIKYYKVGKLHYLIISLIFFVFGILSKEHTIIAVAIPILLSIRERKIISKNSIFIAVLMSIIAILILLYRIYIIGGSPFASGNFSDINSLSFIKNYFSYYFLTIFRPEELETLYYLFLDNIVISISMIFIVLVFLIIKILKSSKIKLDNDMLFGFLWFSVAILPALPYLMRWYQFMPSIGLLIILTKIITKHSSDFLKVAIIIMIFFNMIIVNINYRNWQEASENMEKITNTGKISTGIEKMRIWAAPDKYERINMLKIAPDVYFSSVFGIDKDSIDSPVRCEYYRNSSIIITKENQSIKLVLTNGRIFPRGAKSTSIFRSEHFYLNNDEYSAEIESNFSGNNYISTLRINYKKDNVKDLFFNAVNFTDEKNIK